MEGSGIVLSGGTPGQRRWRGQHGYGIRATHDQLPRRTTVAPGKFPCTEGELAGLQLAHRCRLLAPDFTVARGGVRCAVLPLFEQLQGARGTQRPRRMLARTGAYGRHGSGTTAGARRGLGARPSLPLALPRDAGQQMLFHLRGELARQGALVDQRLDHGADFRWRTRLLHHRRRVGQRRPLPEQPGLAQRLRLRLPALAHGLPPGARERGGQTPVGGKAPADGGNPELHHGPSLAVGQPPL